MIAQKPFFALLLSSQFVFCFAFVFAIRVLLWFCSCFQRKNFFNFIFVVVQEYGINSRQVASRSKTEISAHHSSVASASESRKIDTNTCRRWRVSRALTESSCRHYCGLAGRWRCEAIDFRLHHTSSSQRIESGCVCVCVCVCVCFFRLPRCAYSQRIESLTICLTPYNGK